MSQDINQPNGGTPSVIAEATTDGDNDRLGLLAAIVEAWLSWLGLGDTKTTRKANRYQAKDRIKANKLSAVARYMSIKISKVTAFDVEMAGLRSFVMKTLEGRQVIIKVRDAAFTTALNESPALRRACGAYIAVSQWFGMAEAERNILARTMQLTTGQAVSMLEEGFKAANAQAFASLGLEEGMPIRHIIVQNEDMMKARPRVLVKNKIDTLDSLVLSASNAQEWFNHVVFNSAVSCAKFEGGCGTGSQGVEKAADGCIYCGRDARLLRKQQPTGHLVEMSKNGGPRVFAGYSTHLVSIRMNRAAQTQFERMSRGQITAHEVIEYLMKNRDGFKVRESAGSTRFVPAVLRPVWMEVMGTTEGVTDLFGLAIERVAPMSE